MPPERAVELVGETDEALVSLLRDVLADLHLSFDPHEPETPPALVLAIVDRTDLSQTLTAARTAARGAPIVALLQFTDDELIRRSLARGAVACLALDTPLELLRRVILGVLRRRAAPDPPTTRGSS